MFVDIVIYRNANCRNYTCQNERIRSAAITFVSSEAKPGVTNAWGGRRNDKTISHCFVLTDPD